MSDTAPKGIPVVLTADRTLMAAYSLLLDGMVSTSQTTSTPEFLWRTLLAPGINGSFRALQAPLGLRRVEAALVAGGFPEEDVAVVTPEELPRAVGPRTRIVGLSSGDPLGIGMSSSTMTALSGGEILCGSQFRRLAGRVSAITSGLGPGGPRVIMGGPGAWQLTESEEHRARLGIDHVVSGYCEDEIASIFGRLVEGEDTEPVVRCSYGSAEAIPAIRGATVMGVVEISRGCGMGCHFCTMATIPMRHLSVDRVVADVRTNLPAGVRNISLIREDVFRYGAASATEVAPERLKSLLRAVRALEGVHLIQIDHANVSSVAAVGDDDLAEVHDLMAGESGAGTLWVNLGVETAAGELLEMNGGAAKVRPFGAADWGDACREQVLRASRAGFLPMVSLVVGMDGETTEDLRRTIKWVESLAGERVSVFPVFSVATREGEQHFTESDMTPLHWQLFEASYRLNFRWIPELYRQSLAGNGVGLLRRALLKVLGKVEAVRLGRRIRRLARGGNRRTE